MLQSTNAKETVPHPSRERATSGGTPKTSRLAGSLSIEALTVEYRQRGYAGTLKALCLTPTDYNLLTKDAPHRDELLTLTAQEVREFEAAGVKLTGVFCSRGTAINLTKDLLFRELPGFEQAHSRGDIETMAKLYRTKVIGFRSPDGKGTGQKAFFAYHGLGTVVANTTQMGLPKKNSVSSLLGLVFPGLVDHTDPDALHPNEVERGYWNDRENVRRHFFGALNALPGFAQAHQAGDIDAMIALWRKHVSAYVSSKTDGRGTGDFFAEQAGLKGFLCDPHPKLGYMERGIRPVIQDLLPELFEKMQSLGDLRPEGYWQKVENVRAEVLRVLYEVPGFQAAHESRDVPTMCRLYREHVIGYRPRPGAWGGQKLFYADKGCSSAFQMRAGARALGLSEGSFREVLGAIVPELFDVTVPEHIKQNEVAARVWTPETMRKATLDLLYTIPGFERAHQERDVALMSSLYRMHVVGYRSKCENSGGQRAFFWENGLLGLLGNARSDLGFQRKNSPYDLMRLVVPEIFDPSCPTALSERELTQYYWSVRENALKGILDALYRIDGFEEAHTAGNIAKMADLYRINVVGYRGSSGKGGQQAYFTEVGGLISLFNKARENFGWSKSGSPAEGLRLALPELVDPAHPDALRRSEIEHYLIPDHETLREHLLGGLFEIPGFRAAFEAGEIGTMANLYREHVIRYPGNSVGGGRGQVAYMRDVCNLGPVLGRRHPELGITRLACPAQILEAVIPQLVDVGNPDALSPNEVQHSYWTLETLCTQALESLLRIPGFSEAYAARNIREMAALYREFVIEYASESGTYGGQYAFLREQARIPNLAYVDQGSGKRVRVRPFDLLEHAIPGLVNEDDQEALSPTEVGINYWNDPEVVSRNVIRALHSLPGFKEAHEDYDIATMAEIYRRDVLGFVTADGSQGGQKVFFEEMGLLSIANHKESLGYDQGHLFAEIISSCVPGLVDDENPEALALNELSRRVWHDEEYIAQRIRAGLLTIEGFADALESNDITRMAQLYEKYVRSFVDPASGEAGQRAFFRLKARLGACLNSGRYHGHSDSNSMAYYLNLVVPGLVDADNPKALQPSRVTVSYWTEDVRLKRLKDVLRAIPGWQTAEDEGDVSVLANLYRTHILSFYDPIRQVGGQTAFFASVGLLAVAQPRKGHSLTELLKEAYPGLVDPVASQALHPSEISKAYWGSVENVRESLLAALYRVPGFEEAHQRGELSEMVALYRSHIVGYRSAWSACGGQTQWFIEEAHMGALLTSGRLMKLGLSPRQSKNPCAALMALACPEIAQEVADLQSERLARFVRGSLFERLCGLVCSFCESDVRTERFDTRLVGASGENFYPDALVNQRIIDFKWGRAYEDIRRTIVKYAAVAALSVNRDKVLPVDQSHPILIFALEPRNTGVLDTIDEPHQIISIIDLLDPRCSDAEVVEARRLLGWKHSDDFSGLMRTIFEYLRRLEREEPDDPERNLYALNGLLDDVLDLAESGVEECIDALSSFRDLLKDLCVTS